MTGSFGFDDALLGNVITFGDLEDLEIEVFLGGRPVGARSLRRDGPGSFAEEFVFNFDSATGLFGVGGYSGGPLGQQWFIGFGGAACDSVGFGSGSWAQGVCTEDLGFVDEAAIFLAGYDGRASTLTATRLSDAPAVIPLPASLPLLAGGLFGLGLLAGRRRR